uniref:Sodium/calcium exchanger membrane region domain-containing protein n=4 Tax=Clytia hemisphaerica TaxID=252671 RepID=A0A7M5XCC0_9CNID
MCSFSEKNRAWCYVLLLLWMLYMFISLGVTAEDFFCPSLKAISKFLRMSDSLAGVTLLALGNGAPDIFSVIAAVNNKNPRTTAMAFQELFGAGIFVTTIVAGSINFSTTFMMARRPFLRDNIFYLVAVIWTFVVIYRREIKTIEATGFIALYVLYVSIVIIGQIVNRFLRRRTLSQSRERLMTVASTDDENSGVNHSVNQGLDQQQVDIPSPMDVGGDNDERPLINEDDELVPRMEGADESQPISPISITESPQPKRPRHPKHRLIRDMSLSADFSSYNYSSDVAHLFKENRYKDDKNIFSDLVYTNNDSVTMKDFVRPMNIVERLTGIRKVNWQNQSKLSKAFSIIQVPIIFMLSITCPVVDRDVQGQKWDKWLSIWHCFASPIFVVFALQVGTVSVYNDFLVYHLVLVIGSILGCLLYFISSSDYTPKFHVIFALFGFAVAVVWIKCTAQEVVNLLQTFGWISHLSYGIMGLTLLAWGNSIGDFISNLTMARNGAPRMAIAACYGGPLLNMLLGVGISCTISAIRDGGEKSIIRGSTQYILSAMVLAISLLSAIIILPLHKFMSSKYIGFYLFGLYALYLTLSVLHEADILNL